jgi:hypothetical protein
MPLCGITETLSDVELVRVVHIKTELHVVIGSTYAAPRGDITIIK